MKRFYLSTRVEGGKTLDIPSDQEFSMDEMRAKIRNFPPEYEVWYLDRNGNHCYNLKKAVCVIIRKKFDRYYHVLDFDTYRLKRS